MCRGTGGGGDLEEVVLEGKSLSVWFPQERPEHDV